MKLFLLVAGVLNVAPAISAQQTTPAIAPRFEVVSIKPAAVPQDILSRMLSVGGGCGRVPMERVGNRLTIPATLVCSLITFAYDVESYQVIGIPAELTKGTVANLFEINARAGNDVTLTVDDTRMMLRTLLAERFQLRVHREPRTLSVYALTTAKGGPKLTPCSDPEISSRYMPGVLLSCQPPMAMNRVVQLLSRAIERPVIDKTGMTGTYTFELRWQPENAPPQPDALPTLFTAIQEQLGLKLESQRSPVEAIVVDSVERPNPN